MNIYTLQVARKDQKKWIFIHSESLGSIENEFLYIPSHSETKKMDFYTHRVAQNV